MLLQVIFSMYIPGSIGSCPLAFILPCLFHIKINKMCMSKLEILQDVTIVVFGIVCGVVGFVVSLMEIITRIWIVQDSCFKMAIAVCLVQ